MRIKYFKLFFRLSCRGYFVVHVFGVYVIRNNRVYYRGLIKRWLCYMLFSYICNCNASYFLGAFIFSLCCV
jgi:hypothetical protein